MRLISQATNYGKQKVSISRRSHHHRRISKVVTVQLLHNFSTTFHQNNPTSEASLPTTTGVASGAADQLSPLYRRYFSSSGGGATKAVSSTGSTTYDDDEGDEEEKKLLTVALIQANEISLLASTVLQQQRSTVTTKSKGILLNQTEVMEASETLLKLTSHSSFSKVFQQHQKHNNKNKIRTAQRAVDVTTSLHSAFINVISWLCSTLTSLKEEKEKDCVEILLQQLLQLKDKSIELQLPLPLQLYKTIGSLIGKYYTTNNAPATNFNLMETNNKECITIVILDLAMQVEDILSCNTTTADVKKSTDDTTSTVTATKYNTIIDASFFSQPLKELLIRDKVRNMVDLLQGMRNIHCIEHVEFGTGMELLTMIGEKMELSSLGKKNKLWFQEEDAVELALMLQRPVLEALNVRKRELTDYQRLLDTTIDNLLSDDNDEDDKLTKENYHKEGKQDTRMEQPQVVLTDDNDDDELDRHFKQLSEMIKSTMDDDDHGMEDDNELVKIKGGKKKNIKHSKEEVKKIANTIIEKLKQRSSSKKENDASNTTSTNKDDNIDDPYHQHMASSSTVDDAAAIVDSGGHVAARLHVDPSTGEIHNIDFQYTPNASTPKDNNSSKEKYDKYHNMLAEDLIYIRDARWKIPDIVSQLEEWNGERGIFFTKDFEASLIKDIQNDCYNDDYDDNLFEGEEEDGDDIGHGGGASSK